VLPAADQVELKRSRVGHVDGYVDEVLPDPPGADRGGERLAALREKIRRQPRRHGELPEGPSQEVGGLPERDQEQVARLVEGEIHEVERTGRLRRQAQANRPVAE